VKSESPKVISNPPLPLRATSNTVSQQESSNESVKPSQFRETLNKQLSSMQMGLKKVEQDAVATQGSPVKTNTTEVPVKPPKPMVEPAVPVKTASPNLPVKPKSFKEEPPKEESNIPPWKLELEKRKLQQQQL
jgi:hypothetical protein